MDQAVRKTLRLSKTEYYETHLSLVNCVLPVKLTPKEIQVLAAFMGLEGDISAYRFGPSAKKIVRSQLKLSPAGLSNYMGSFLKSGFLIQQGDMIKILPVLMPKNDEQTYSFKLVNLNGNVTATTNTAQSL